ncbi:T9SS type A sorting domain-containing protein [Neptunitalea chrysea]|uniref:T9SS type A sorting domain-containing protein n=1 Tax=Neptunitalea chrysea TaxID=1647581 RepID=UPI0035A247C1
MLISTGIGNTSANDFTFLQTVNFTLDDYETFVVNIPTNYLGQDVHIAFRVNGTASDTSVNIRVDNVATVDATLGLNNINVSNTEIYPNPIKNILNIKAEDIIAADIYNVLGQKQDVTFSNNQIDMAALEKGVYLLKVQTLKGSSTTKLIKE